MPNASKRSKLDLYPTLYTNSQPYGFKMLYLSPSYFKKSPVSGNLNLYLLIFLFRHTYKLIILYADMHTYAYTQNTNNFSRHFCRCIYIDLLIYV